MVTPQIILISANLEFLIQYLSRIFIPGFSKFLFQQHDQHLNRATNSQQRFTVVVIAAAISGVLISHFRIFFLIHQGVVVDFLA